MKVTTEVLKDFLTKSRMSEVNSCLLQFKEEGLFIGAISPANTQQCNAVLYSKNFTDYTKLGNVGVDDLYKLINVLKKLDKEIEITVEGNLMTLKGSKKEVSFELVDEKFIDEPKIMRDDYGLDNTFKIPAETLASFLSDAQTNKDATVFFETVEGGVKLYNDGKYQFKYNIDSEGTSAGTKLRFGKPIIDTLTEIKKGELVCQAKSEMPILIKHETEDYKMRFLVAPRADDK